MTWLRDRAVMLARRMQPGVGIRSCRCVQISSGEYWEPPDWEQAHDCPYHGTGIEARVRSWICRRLWIFGTRNEPF